MRVSRWWQGLAAAFLFTALAAPAQAQVAAGYSEYYIPGSEDAISIALRSLGGTAASVNTHALIAITSWSDNIIVYYDHWEDGIEFDPDNPEATYDEKFTMATTGTLLSLDNTPVGGIPVPRNSANVYYDGGDRMYVVGGAVTVTRVAYRENPGRSVQAVAWEIYPVKPQLTTYVLPFGQNLSVAPKSYTDFLKSYVIVQATANNTTFTVDLDGNGTADPLDRNFDGDTTDPGENQPVTLQAGQSFFLGNVTAGLAPIPPLGALATINSNAVIQGSSTLQVKFIVGDPNVNYETRGLSAFPRGYWTKEYYAPVGEPATAPVTDIFLYNPNAAAITITYETQAATGTFTINSKDTLSYRAAVGGALPTAGGVYLRGSDAFWGVSTIDSTGAANEWAYSLLPSTLLYQEHFLGWAPGGADGNDSGVFLTPVQDNTRVFVDTNNDGTADQTYTLSRLQTRYITDTDGDLSGTRFWATGPFTMSYGQNPDTAPAQATSGDLGYVAIPGADFISLVLTVDKSVSPQVVPTAIGSTATFTLTANSHKYDVDAVSVVDTLPANWGFVGPAAITLPDKTTVATAPTVTAAGAALPPAIGGTCLAGSGGCLSWDGSVLGSLAENQEIVITFTAQTTAVLANGTLSQNRVRATGTRTVGGQIQTFNATDFAYVASGSLGITKTSTAPDPAYPGDQFAYTVKVTNGAAAQTGVSLYDALPAGVSYVAASSAATCDLTSNVRDQFGVQAYNNNNGTRNWAGDWTETDRYGTGATGAGSGFIWVTTGVLQLRYQLSTVEDDFSNGFDTDSTAIGGTSDWSAASWTEVDSGGAGAGTGFVRAESGPQLNFDGSTTGTATGNSIRRALNLDGASWATLTFDFDRNSQENDDDVLLQLSSDGVNFTTIFTYDGSVATGAKSHDISAYISATTTIRFSIGSGFANNNDESYFDNLAVTYAGARIQRTANLTGATSATLSFSFAHANLEAADQIVVEASSDGASFTTLETFSGSTPLVPATRSYNLMAPTNFAAANTTIRFRVIGGLNAAGETFSVDNVDITYSPTTIAAGTPPNLLDSGTICSSMAAGGTLTVTYNVTVDNPLASGLSAVTNTASVTTTQIPLALTATVTDPLANPSVLTASVAGRVFFDGVTYGTAELGESGIPNVEVTLKDRFGTPVATTYTDTMNGGYSFTGIAPGTGYYVEVTDGLPAGVTQTYPAGSAGNRTASFNLAAGQDGTGVDLGYRLPAGTAVFGDLVWADADGDNVRDGGEVGLGGVAVTIWRDTVVDDILDTSCADVELGDPPGCDTQVASATTAPDGSYLIAGVPATGTETYFAIANGPEGHFATGNAVHRFFNTAVGVYLTADFGFQADGVDAFTYVISDRVWLDAGLLGTYEAGEPGIAGVTVVLLDASRNVIGTTTTAADGTFSFTGVAGGGADYTVRITDTGGVLADHFGTAAAAIAREYDVNNLMTASVDNRGLGDASFGFAVSRSIGDTVFNDSSGGAGDGVQQVGELGIAGVVVSLYRDNGAAAGFLDGTDTLVGTVTTDANGRYLFSGLTNADYIVSVTPPAGYNYIGVLVPDTDPAAGIQRTATILGGGNVLFADFGFRAPIQRTVSGTVWEDDNADGVIDAVETARLAGLTIEIVSGTTVVATITTDGSGNYSVGGLVPGSYTVRVVDPGGILTGYSASIPATGERTVDLALADVNDANFGFRLPPTTRVFLAGFRATAAPQGVIVEWETTAEIGTVGYRILRVEGGDEVPVNERIVPAFVESRSGGRYALADPGASGSPLTYILLEVRRSGAPVPYGPFTVTPAPADARDGAAPAAPAVADGRDSARAPLALPDGKAYARAARRPAPRLSRQTVALDLPVPQLDAVGSKVRVAVTRDGLYRLFASEIAGLLGKKVGGIATRINEGSLLLSNRGLPVAYLPRDGGASLVFYGTALDTNFTGENVYWLEIGAGKKMRKASVTAAKPSAKAKHFPDGLRFKERMWPDFLAATDPNADYWLWTYLVAGEPPPPDGLGFVNISLDAPTPAGAGLQATLTVRLVGGSDTAADPDHHVIVRLNGTQIGEANWNGLAAIDVPCAFDQGLLTGSDEVEIEALLDTGAPESLVYLESIHLDYRRRFVAVGNRLVFTGGGNGAVTVSGFTDPAILLFELKDPNRPRLLSGAAIAGSEGNYSVTFRPASPAIPYLAIAQSAVGLPAAVAAWNSTGLAAATNAAKYLVITGAGLLEAAVELAERRAGQGLSTKIVTVPAIMDEFNAGIYDPAAIRSFIATALVTWEEPPRYVLLAGDGSYDYRDFLKEPGTDTPIVPPAFVPTPYGLAAADGWYADTDGDHVPEAAVGRLPALTNAELQGLVDKIAAFEDAASGAWDKALLFLADNKDAAAGDFPADSDALLAALPADLTATKDYVGTMPIASARTLFKSAVNTGVAHVSYFGHGGFDALADEGLVRLEYEVPALVNGERLPLFTLFTCIAGDYTDPYLVNLGEGLLLRAGGGASAVLAPTGDAVHQNSAWLADKFFTLRYGGGGGGGPRLGDVVVKAMEAYRDGHGGDFTLEVYNLLGDPGLLLR